MARQDRYEFMGVSNTEAGWERAFDEVIAENQARFALQEPEPVWQLVTRFIGWGMALLGALLILPGNSVFGVGLMMIATLLIARNRV